MVTYADLFCGLGAFHAAFDEHNRTLAHSKYECVFACDINPKVRKLYEDNYGITPEGDIYALDIRKVPRFDILCAGFPCQPFSIAGKKEGFDAKRGGNMFFKLLEIIDAKNPTVLMLENVKHLLTINSGNTFDLIKRALMNRGYTFSYKVIDSRMYNSPQSRTRIYIICNLHKEYVFRNVQYPLVPVSSIIDNNIQTFIDYEKKYKLIPCNGNKMMLYKLIHKSTGKGGRQGERVYDITKCGPTVCATSGGLGAKTGLYNFDGKFRTLTIQETLKMFGFKHSYKYHSLSTPNDMLFFLGNSIVVNVIIELIYDL